MGDTSISISKEFHNWLKSKGKKGEKYEDIIKRMLKPEFLNEIKQENSNVKDILEQDS